MAIARGLLNYAKKVIPALQLSLYISVTLENELLLSTTNSYDYSISTMFTDSLIYLHVTFKSY
jgi:hypothetical protein